MSFQTLTQYRMICDGCHRVLADYGTREFNHKSTAFAAARKRGWQVITPLNGDGLQTTHRCPECRTQPAEELAP